MLKCEIHHSFQIPHLRSAIVALAFQRDSPHMALRGSDVNRIRKLDFAAMTGRLDLRDI